MLDYFPKAKKYFSEINLAAADPLDKKANELLNDPDAYERASQALRRRFVRGATEVESVDRGMRAANIKREKAGGKFNYFIQGQDGNWFGPEERLWVVAMYALWQDMKT